MGVVVVGVERRRRSRGRIEKKSSGKFIVWLVFFSQCLPFVMMLRVGIAEGGKRRLESA